jgi:hypothetical protein
MHAAEGPAWALALEHTALGEAMRGGVLLYPLVETGHILGFATLVGSILVLDARLIGLTRGLRPKALLEIAVPIAAGGLALAATTGAMLFMTEAAGYAENPAFWAKQSLIALGLANIAVFHRILLPAAETWPTDAPPPWPARVSGTLSALT